MTIPALTMAEALRELQSRSIRHRRRGAGRLASLSFASHDHPSIDTAKLRQLEHLVGDATRYATDMDTLKRVRKQNMRFVRAFPGYVPLLICTFLQFFTPTPHLVLAWLFTAATLFLLFWSFRLGNQVLQELRRPAAAALELAKELGLA